MEKVKFTLVTIAMLAICSSANAQLGGLRRAVDRGVQKAVEKKAEQKTAEAVDKAADKAFESAERQRKRGEDTLDKALTRADSIAEANAVELDASQTQDAPQIAPTPYTPAESEYVFFGMKKGLVQVFVQKDAKGKVQSQTRNTITQITGSKNAFAIDYQSEMLDKNGKPADRDNPLVLNYRIVVKDGVMYLDLKGMFGAMQGLEGVSVSGSAMKIPTNLSVGQTLPDANASVRIGFIKMNVEMTEGKVLAYEDLTTEAGTFKCYKLTQNTKAMGVKGTTVTYYAKGAGAVKTETYDSKGKLMQSVELISSN